MRIWLVLICLMIVPGLAESEQKDRSVDFPDVPRVTAYEAYTKYKAGQAIIVQAGGEDYERRHIVGTYGNKNISGEGLRQGKTELPNFPFDGIEIFTYCY
jgi:hypothetical protein